MNTFTSNPYPLPPTQPLRCASLTGYGLGGLAPAPVLCTLSLLECQVEDSALADLASLRHLTLLTLDFCPGISDSGLAALGTLPALRTLNLRGCEAVRCAMDTAWRGRGGGGPGGWDLMLQQCTRYCHWTALQPRTRLAFPPWHHALLAHAVTGISLYAPPSPPLAGAMGSCRLEEGHPWQPSTSAGAPTCRLRGSTAWCRWVPWEGGAPFLWGEGERGSGRWHLGPLVQ